MQSTQYRALESLKRSHTNLHQSIERMQNGESTVVGKANIAKIICELSHALARLWQAQNILEQNKYLQSIKKIMSNKVKNQRNKDDFNKVREKLKEEGHDIGLQLLDEVVRTISVLTPIGALGHLEKIQQKNSLDNKSGRHLMRHFWEHFHKKLVEWAGTRVGVWIDFSIKDSLEIEAKEHYDHSLIEKEAKRKFLEIDLHELEEELFGDLEEEEKIDIICH